MLSWRKPRSYKSLSELSKATRFAYRVHVGLVQRNLGSPDAVAQHFGLRALGEDWRQIERNVAQPVLSKLLVEDMAYNKRRLSDAEADALATEFLSPFSANAVFYTNGNWEVDPEYVTQGSGAGHSWLPATSATFDGGVIAVDENQAGVLWLEDED